jgi:putative NADPH-quinone reductase
MNVLIVYAHPEAHSLNGALNAFAISHLENSGHHVQVSDLYAMNWKSQLDASDTLARWRVTISTRHWIQKRPLSRVCKVRISLANRRNYAGQMRSFSSFRCGGFRCLPL